jgi:hypothetical protein
MGLPMLYRISFLKDRRSALTPSLPPSSFFSYLLFWKIADRYKCAQKNRRDLTHTTDFPLLWG